MQTEAPSTTVGREPSNQAPPPVRLPAKGALLRLQAGCRVGIECLEGLLWITQTGDPRDHLLAPGERMETTGRGLLLAEALTAPALLRLTPAARPNSPG